MEENVQENNSSTTISKVILPFINNINWKKDLLILILLIIVSIISFWFGKQQSYKVEIPNPLPPCPTLPLNPTEQQLVKEKEESRRRDENVIDLNLQGWQLYQSDDKTISFYYPPTWQIAENLRGEIPWSVSIEDPQKKYLLFFKVSNNYNQMTGKPFSSFSEYTGLQYINIVNVGEQEADQVCPRAGCENDNSVVFFSKDNKWIYDLSLGTNFENDNEIKSSQQIFKSIITSFKFN